MTKTKTQPASFGSVQLFYIKNQKLYCFWVFFVIFNGSGSGLARFFSLTRFGSVILVLGL
jgi:hypothetical protein